MLFSTNASVEAGTIEEKEKTNENGKRYFTGFAPRASTHTNYRVLWVLLGSVAILTVGFCYLFNYMLRIFEVHRRNGERLKDVLRVRLDEQNEKY